MKYSEEYIKNVNEYVAKQSFATKKRIEVLKKMKKVSLREKCKEGPCPGNNCELYTKETDCIANFLCDLIRELEA